MLSNKLIRKYFIDRRSAAFYADVESNQNANWQALSTDEKLDVLRDALVAVLDDQHDQAQARA